MTKPSAAEQDRFLSQYGFAEDVIVERIEIDRHGMFEFFMFAAWDPKLDEVRLLTMWPDAEKAYAELT